MLVECIVPCAWQVILRRGGDPAPCISFTGPAEQPADVYFVVWQAGEANVSIFDDVHFEIGLERKVASVNFEAKPMPAVARGLSPATIGADGAFAEAIFTIALVFPQFSA